MGDSNLLELLDMYIDMVEKQDEAIHQLSELIKKQAFEIAHMKNICGFADEKALEQTEGTKLVQEVLVKYGKL